MQSPTTEHFRGTLECTATREPRDLWVMLALLAPATIFQGYDVTIFYLCTPDIARTFHLGIRSVGAMASVVQLGSVLSFIVVSLADHIGRKPVLSLTVLGYAFFTLCTALTRGVATFMLFQGAAQIFLGAELAVAVIMVSEEFPDRWRGSGVAIMNAIGLVGVVAAGSLYAWMAESRWGWRGMYVVGIAPLMLVLFLRRGLRETARFQALKASGPPPAAFLVEFAVRLRATLHPLRGRYRRRLLLVAALWNCVGLVSAPAVTYFSLYAKRDHHWSSAEIGAAVVISYVVGTFGHLLCGWLLDKLGRKQTTSGFYVAGALGMLILFKVDSRVVMLAALIATVFAFQGARTATATFSAELFPTEIRAASYSWTVQVLGQAAGILSPVTIGLLSSYVGGLGNAIAAVCIGPILGAAMVLRYAPETRAMKLEDRVSGDSTSAALFMGPD